MAISQADVDAYIQSLVDSGYSGAELDDAVAAAAAKYDVEPEKVASSYNTVTGSSVTADDVTTYVRETTSTSYATPTTTTTTTTTPTTTTTTPTTTTTTTPTTTTTATTSVSQEDVDAYIQNLADSGYSGAELDAEVAAAAAEYGIEPEKVASGYNTVTGSSVTADDVTNYIRETTSTSYASEPVPTPVEPTPVEPVPVAPAPEPTPVVMPDVSGVDPASVTQTDVNTFISDLYTSPTYASLTDEQRNTALYDAASQLGVSRESVLTGLQQINPDLTSQSITEWVTSDPNRSRLGTQVSDVTGEGVGMDVQDFNALMSGGLTDENWLEAYDLAQKIGMTVEQASLFSGADWYGVDDFGYSNTRDYLNYGGTPYEQAFLNDYISQFTGSYGTEDPALVDLYGGISRYEPTEEQLLDAWTAATGQELSGQELADWLGGQNLPLFTATPPSSDMYAQRQGESLTDYYNRLRSERTGGILGQGMLSTSPTVGSDAYKDIQTLAAVNPEGAAALMNSQAASYMGGDGTPITPDTRGEFERGYDAYLFSQSPLSYLTGLLPAPIAGLVNAGNWWDNKQFGEYLQSQESSNSLLTAAQNEYINGPYTGGSSGGAPVYSDPNTGSNYYTGSSPTNSFGQTPEDIEAASGGAG